MTKQNKLPGYCFFCENTYDKRGISRHLKSCKARKEAEAAEKGKRERLFQIRVESPYVSDYWLDIEMAANNTLDGLDSFLRDVWLECCGHLSQFTINDVYYISHLDPSSPFGGWRKEHDMNISLAKTLPMNKKIRYEYDLGSTTGLTIKVMAERQGSLPRGKKVRFLSRNFAPAYLCSVCQKETATWVNVFDYEAGIFCDQHAKEHQNWSEGFLPLVNSPRAGVCGYWGTENEDYRFEKFA